MDQTTADLLKVLACCLIVGVIWAYLNIKR